MKLQKILYPSTDNCQEELLYFRRVGNEKCKYILADEYITLNKDGGVSFDTYFNSFSASKWFKYSKIDNVSLKLKLNGKFFITLLYLEKLPDQLYTMIVDEVYCDTEGADQEVSLNYNCNKTQGMYAFRITSLKRGGKFYSGGYYTDLKDMEVANVNLGIVICTFRREDFVYKNMDMLRRSFLDSKDSLLKDKLKVYISDNGKTLDEEKIGSENIKVYPNKNVGGSGGFTRGMIECLKEKDDGGITHVLLMDDDIVIQPESIFRTYTLLALIKPEYKNSYIGGAMLRLDKQWFQTEAGGLWNAGRLLSRKSGLDLRDVDACLFNEIEEKCDYNAWWYCTIPMEFVRDDNLPIPIFIRGDDAEYGLRNMENLILMNGICVWHEPFEFKFSSAMYYYIFRNRLIDNALRGIQFNKKQFLGEFRSWLVQELFTYRYKNAELLIKGVNDFLNGIEWLKQQDGETLNLEIMKKGYRFQDISDLEVAFDFGTYEHTLASVEGKKHRFMRRLLLNGIFMSAHGDAIVPTVGPHIYYFYRKERALHYDFTSKKGFVTKRDNKEFMRLVKEYRKLKKNVMRNYDKVVANYRTRGTELMQLDFWNNYLGID